VAAAAAAAAAAVAVALAAAARVLRSSDRELIEDEVKDVGDTGTVTPSSPNATRAQSNEVDAV